MRQNYGEAEKLLSVNKMIWMVSEDCDVLKIIESLRNGALHNVSWKDTMKIQPCRAGLPETVQG